MLNTVSNYGIVNQNHNVIPLHMIFSKENNKYWWRCEEIGTLIHWSGDFNVPEPFWKTIWHFFNMLNIDLAYDPVIPLLDVHQRELKTCPHRNFYEYLQQYYS